MPEPIVIIGCGGHGREILGIVTAINEHRGDTWKVLGFVDDKPSDTNLRLLKRLDADYLGPVAALAAMDARFVIGIGDPRVRARIAERTAAYGLKAAQLVHPDATVGLDNAFSEGVVLFPGARVTTNVTLGPHVHLNQNATVGHDSVLGDCTQVNPLAAVSGSCSIGPRVLIGTTAAVLQGIAVGSGATVGAGACVVRDVPELTTVKGVPARP
ncbi:acetyltransferase [Krasilnikovia sp. MM14-A1004]|uniref:acetyltransferase n=1 Tax=Krasilnikovia sp. MM14-A1004 TaxID=3373541 RepID=UPI00399D4391